MSQRPFCFHYSKFSCPVKPWIIPRLFLYPGFLFASAELAGKRGGGDVAALLQREMALNGAQILHAGEFPNVSQVQKLSPTGKGEDLFQIVIVKIVDHGGRPLLLCRDC